MYALHIEGSQQIPRYTGYGHTLYAGCPMPTWWKRLGRDVIVSMTASVIVAVAVLWDGPMPPTEARLIVAVFAAEVVGWGSIIILRFHDCKIGKNKPPSP